MAVYLSLARGCRITGVDINQHGYGYLAEKPAEI
jgi:hypothetical protein